MPELAIRIEEYIGESCFNWDTFEFERATSAADVRMFVEWAQYDGLVVDSILLEIGKCYGGSTFEGKEIYHYLQGLGLPIRTRILSFAGSMGSIIPLAGDVVEIEASAQILVHGPSGGADGTVQEVASGLQMLSNERDALRDIYVARTGQPVEVVEEWMSKDTFFTAQEALAVGLVTKVIPLAPKAAPALTDAQASARRARFAGIVARADKRAAVRAAVPKPKAKNAAQPAPTPRPMAKKVIPISAAAKAAAAKPAALTAQQKANANAVAALAKSLGVKAEIEGVDAVEAPTAEVVETVLADGAGSLYSDGELAQGSEVYNDEALTTATADGVYGTEDGRDVTVAAGVVESIADTTAEGGEEPTAAGTEAITAAITAALTPLTKRLDTMEATFNKAVPPLPRAKTAVQGPDAKNTPKPKAAHHSTM